MRSSAQIRRRARPRSRLLGALDARDFQSPPRSKTVLSSSASLRGWLPFTIGRWWSRCGAAVGKGGAHELPQIFPGRARPKLCLSQIDPSSKEQHDTSGTAVGELEDNRQKLTRLQALLYAEHKHSRLIVLQAMDAGGKAGTLNHVFAAFNAQGTTVTGFKQPTPFERDHDFLWRVHPHVPGPGKVAIFNRSHYEDVLITRVHKLIDEATCKAR